MASEYHDLDQKHLSTEVDLYPRSCENNILFRGHFDATGEETAANLSINGGTAFAASVWINDAFIDTIGTLSDDGDANGLFTFPEGSIKAGADNVVTVLLDHMGNDEWENRMFSSRSSICLNLIAESADSS